MTSVSTISVRIRGYQFTLSAPYRLGEPLGEAEVQQLNDLRADNIRNNLTKMVVDALAGLGEGQMLSPSQLAELQRRIGDYDSKYSLQLKHQSRPRVGAIEAEARAIAEERLDAQLRESGTSVTHEEYARMLGEFVLLDTVQAAARERLAAKQQVLRGGLEELL